MPAELRSSSEKTAPRVMHYLPSTVRAGVEEHAISIANSIGKHGMVAYVGAPQQLLQAIGPDLADDVRTIAVEIHSPLDWRGRMKLGADLRRHRINLLHCHMFDASLFAAPVARLVGVSRIVETNHGAEMWREQNSSAFKRSFWMDRQIGRLIDLFIAVSNGASRHLRERKGIPERRIRVIQNGRDLSRYHPASEDQRRAAREEFGFGNRRVILTVGRLEEQKGHKVLIEALPLLRDKWPDLAVIFAGNGPLEAELRQLCEARGVADLVDFFGFTNRPEALMTAADLVVLPSFYEGLPLVAIEALGLERPMVATNVPGTDEIVIDGRTGLLVPPGNSAALADAIDRMLRDSDLASKLARQGRAHVEGNFDVRIQNERTVQLYRQLLAS